MAKRKKIDPNEFSNPLASTSGKDVKAEILNDSKKEKPKKVKNTYHLTFNVALQLDEIQLEMRRVTGEKISKTEIVEAALQVAFADYERLRERAPFIEIMMAKRNS